MKKICSIFLAILLFTNCKKSNAPETITSVQQKIKGKWQIGQETIIQVNKTRIQTMGIKGNTSNSYTFTADSVFRVSDFLISGNTTYTVISPNQIVFKSGLFFNNPDTLQIQTLTNSNCTLYARNGNDSIYTAIKVELNR